MGFAVVVVAITAVAEVTVGTALESFAVVAIVVAVAIVADSAVAAVVDKQFAVIVLASIVAVVVSIVVAVVVIVILEEIVVAETVVVEPNNVAVLSLLDTVFANLDPAAVVVVGKVSILGSDEAGSPQGTAGCR